MIKLKNKYMFWIVTCAGLLGLMTLLLDTSPRPSNPNIAADDTRIGDVKIHSFNPNTYPKEKFMQCKLDDALPIKPNTVANWYSALSKVSAALSEDFRPPATRAYIGL
jgi:hypothetical protein